MNMGCNSINAYYRVPNISLNDYNNYTRQDLDYSEVIAALYEP